MNIEKSVDNMMRLLREMTPLQRMIVSPGLDRSFEILKEDYPELVVHEYPSGESAGDWICPPSWEVLEGALLDKDDNILASIQSSPLFVAAYSSSVDTVVTKETLAKHMRTSENFPKAYLLEHRYAYNYQLQLKSWGVTLPYEVWESLEDDQEYRIKIRTNTFPGSMKIAEYFIAGESEEIIHINAHIDELCNDDLSGCVVGIELFKYIKSLPKRKYSYQLLLIPETIGSFFYIHNNPETVNKIKAVYNLETLGAGEKLCLKKVQESQRGCYFENVLRLALKEKGVEATEISFFEGYGNDERAFAWPPLDIPGLALQYYPFREYHTSEDTIEIIDTNKLKQSLDVSCQWVDIIETDYIPRLTSLTPPWLTRHNLYFDFKESKDMYHRYNNLLCYSINAKNSVSEIASISGLKFSEVYNYLEKMFQIGAIEKT